MARKDDTVLITTDEYDRMILDAIRSNELKCRMLDDALATVFLLTEGRRRVGSLAVEDFWDRNYEEMATMPDGDLLDDHIRRNAEHFACAQGHPIVAVE